MAEPKKSESEKDTKSQSEETQAEESKREDRKRETSEKDERSKREKRGKAGKRDKAKRDKRAKAAKRAAAESESEIHAWTDGIPLSPVWWAPLFTTLMIVGLLWIVVFYISSAAYPIPALSADLVNLLLGGVRTRTPPSFVCISHAIHILARKSTSAHTLSTGESTAGDKSHACNYPASIPRFTHEFDWMNCVLKPENREISTKI